MKQFISKNLIIVSILHFLVDFLCAGSLVIIYNHFRDRFSGFVYVFLVYNCVAFLSQPLFGLLVDHFKGDRLKEMLRAFMSLSIGVLMLGFVFLSIQIILIPPPSSILAMIIGSIFLGIGNALFHVVGGKEALSISEKATPGGLFVSTGALGIGLASIMLIPTIEKSIQAFFYIAAPIMAIVLTIIYLKVVDEPNVLTYEKNDTSKPKALMLIVVLLCLAVGIRSFLGFYASMSETLTGWGAILLLAVAAFVGKAIGGIFLDMAGPYFLIGISTLMSIVLSIFLSTSYIDFIFVISFNMMMPLTLDALRKCFPNKEAFAFGLAAAFLIPGYLFGVTLKDYGIQNIVVPIICGLTGICLLFIYIFGNKHLYHERNKSINR